MLMHRISGRTGALFADFHMKIDSIFGFAMGDMRFVQLGIEEAMREGKGKKIEVASVWLYVEKIK